MSPSIWTPAALRSEARAYQGTAWRLVEAQHLVSTRKLVDSLEEQQQLEEILEAAKPAVPPACRHLDYLLSTPFRYRPYPHGSRFRRAGFTPGVWYGAESSETAAAEMAFYRLLFFVESPSTPFPDNAGEYTGIGVPLNTAAALDLTAGRLAQDQELWTHVTDYQACQALADMARDTNVHILRYQSVRDPQQRANLAVLDCAAFAARQPLPQRETWRIYISRSGLLAQREFPFLAQEFDRTAYAADPRVAAMTWVR